MTPVNLTIRAGPEGSAEITVSCPCLSLSRDVAAWEDRDAAILELRAERREQAPACRHVWLSIEPPPPRPRTRSREVIR